MKNILVSIPVKEKHKKRLMEAGAGCNFQFVSKAEISDEMAAEASVIIGNVSPDKIKASDKLELLQLESAGTDAYIAPGVLSKNTVLCNSTGAYSRTVSEHSAALTLMLMKKLYLYRDAQAACRWEDFGEVGSPVGARVLVVGLGDIGMQYAKIMKDMGAYVIGVKRRAGDCPEGIDELHLTADIDELLPRADVVFSILPNTKSTAHFYTAERFKLMKNSALFINCGRGNVVESSVLLEALQNKDIAAAATDVTELEPLPEEHPLWKQQNLVITPHVAGGYHLPHTLECIVDIACGNISRWLKAEPFINEVDFETGYKK